MLVTMTWMSVRPWNNVKTVKKCWGVWVLLRKCSSAVSNLKSCMQCTRERWYIEIGNITPLRNFDWLYSIWQSPFERNCPMFRMTKPWERSLYSYVSDRVFKFIHFRDFCSIVITISICLDRLSDTNIVCNYTETHDIFVSWYVRISMLYTWMTFRDYNCNRSCIIINLFISHQEFNSAKSFDKPCIPLWTI